MSIIAQDRTIASCLANGSTNIPLRRTPSKPKTAVYTSNVEKWKQKLDESEQKRKLLLSQNEKNLRGFNDLEKKYNNLQIKIEELETELFEKNENLAKLTTVSKNLFKEYDTLKTQYDTETQAMHRALNDASQWYKENKVLRRRTLLLGKDTVDEGVDTDEADADADLENLKYSVRHLSQEVAQLQAELNSVKLTEFEALESNVNLTQELEFERRKNEKLEVELAQLKESNEQILRVSNIMKRELQELKQMEIKGKENVVTLRKEADDYKRERNVLAHQSTLLMQGLNADEGLNMIMLFQEIEELKRTLEDERNQYNMEINNLQEKIEENETNSHVEILEERLKLVESELQHALRRAEKAENALKEVSTVPLAPPLPPPPPPPPPINLAPPPPTVPLRMKKLARSGVPEIAQALGIEESTAIDSRKIPLGVNDDIINQIKGGTFTLKKSKNAQKRKERETPKAVSEMLNVLGSLRKVSRNKMTVNSTFGDIQL